MFEYNRTGAFLTLADRHTGGGGLGDWVGDGCVGIDTVGGG